MASFQRLERILWFLVSLIIVTTFWVGGSLEDPTDDRILSSSSSRTITAKIVVTQQQQQQQQGHYRNSSLVAAAVPSTGYLWTSNPNIPDWMKEYMDWHTSIVPTLTLDNWQEHRYLVLRCYRKDERCGGVSDRLKPVPLILLAASKSKRIAFIDWDRPCALTEFLVPPRGGLNWVPPAFLVPILQNKTWFVMSRAEKLIEKCQEMPAIMIHSHIHDTQGGATQYNHEFGKGAFTQVYHDLFRILFEPSPAIQRLVDLHLIRKDNKEQQQIADVDNNKLVEGEYAVAHYRAEYGKEIQRHPKLRDPGFLYRVALNAIRCASDLQPGAPIYFASDNIHALTMARKLARQENYPIITFERSEDTPRTLDAWNDSTPQEFYSTFVDLYLAGSGKCVAHGRGGFGRFAAMLSFNATCSIKHVKQFFPVPCKGQAPFRMQDLVGSAGIFAPPAAANNTTTTKSELLYGIEITS